MASPRMLVYVFLIIVGIVVALALLNTYRGFMSQGTRGTHATSNAVGLAVERELERRLSMSIFLSIPYLEEKPSQPLSRLHGVSRLALVMMPPLFAIVPENLVEGDNTSLSCNMVPLSLVQVNSTFYRAEAGARSIHVLYRFNVLSGGVLYTSMHRVGGIVTNLTGTLMYRDGYAEKAVFNTTSVINNKVRTTLTMIQGYHKGIMTSIELVQGQRRLRIIFDNSTETFVIEHNGQEEVLNSSAARSLAELLAKIRGSVRVRVLNETMGTGGAGSRHTYTMLVAINASAEEPLSVGIEARMTITMVEAKPWLLVEVARHIESFKAWMKLGNETYVVTGHDILAGVECGLPLGT